VVRLAGGRRLLRCGSSGREGDRVSQRLAWRRLLSACAALLLLALGWWTLTGGLHDVPQSRTIGQRVETMVRLACGLLSVATVVTRVRWGAWARRVRIAWAVTLAGFVGLSALVWGAPQPKVALHGSRATASRADSAEGGVPRRGGVKDQPLARPAGWHRP
jgi:peptidoglycan/LPS O-acetylase OafA/YrhL